MSCQGQNNLKYQHAASLRNSEILKFESITYSILWKAFGHGPPPLLNSHPIYIFQRFSFVLYLPDYIHRARALGHVAYTACSSPLTPYYIFLTRSLCLFIHKFLSRNNHIQRLARLSASFLIHKIVYFADFTWFSRGIWSVLVFIHSSTALVSLCISSMYFSMYIYYIFTSGAGSELKALNSSL